MKNYLIISFAFFGLLFNSCKSGQTENSSTKLSPTEFEMKIKEMPSASIVDVRTPEEFSEGHLKNAKNMDWNGDDFIGQLASFDKSKPVFVYCLSGRRASAAASLMRSEGFSIVYELEGGIKRWREENLPLENTIIK